MAKDPLEYKIQKEIVEYLKAEGWMVERLIGNAFQMGIPDLFAFHPKWGFRWIDAKRPNQYSFTKAQRAKWPEWERYGCGVWIMTDASQNEYNKLFGPPNWRSYMKPGWQIPTKAQVAALIDELAKKR